MAGYSGTPLAKKLGIKADHVVGLLEPPDGLAALLDPLPPGVALVTDARGVGPYDNILFFTKSLADLKSQFGLLAKRLRSNGGLWVCWPKKSSGVVTDLTEDAIRGIGLGAGLVDNKVCAVDETWSGLRFVIRLRDR